MRHVPFFAAALSIFLAASSAALSAGANGTAEEAKSLLERAISEVRKDQTHALAEFNKGENGFQDRDLYVFCVTLDGKTVAHANPAQLGQDVRALKDASGKEFGKKILSTAKENTIGMVDYRYARPSGGEAVPKQSYVTKIGNLVCGVGYYK